MTTILYKYKSPLNYHHTDVVICSMTCIGFDSDCDLCLVKRWFGFAVVDTVGLYKFVEHVHCSDTIDNPSGTLKLLDGLLQLK